MYGSKPCSWESGSRWHCFYCKRLRKVHGCVGKWEAGQITLKIFQGTCLFHELSISSSKSTWIKHRKDQSKSETFNGTLERTYGLLELENHIFTVYSNLLRFLFKFHNLANLTLGGGFKYVLFSPRSLGKMNPFWLAHIFQMGWNHQLEHFWIINLQKHLHLHMLPGWFWQWWEPKSSRWYAIGPGNTMAQEALPQRRRHAEKDDPRHGCWRVGLDWSTAKMKYNQEKWFQWCQLFHNISTEINP